MNDTSIGSELSRVLSLVSQETRRLRISDILIHYSANAKSGRVSALMTDGQCHSVTINTEISTDTASESGGQEPDLTPWWSHKNSTK